ncbi:LytTR family DNA-binding domain-containing protein [Emticicia sp. W12TSBA100-4]|uniref:LytTR family DNA-binding domain-containing protein n=1 Tax=Emticicia sp. W12TSBA100-4 TaxID=3160965 RepID=UPI0033063AC0
MTRLNLPPVQDIAFLRASVNYTEFHLTDGRKIISSYTLTRHENRVEGFLRINKSYLINPIYIEKVNVVGNKKEVQLKNGERIVVSRRRRGVVDGL